MGKIGILGGTFNPIHNGHVLMAHTAAEYFGFDKVLLVPSNMPPHKELAFGVSAEHRLAMVRLAAADDPLLAVDTIEIERGGVSYAIDTVRALKARSPDDTFAFIIGIDSLLNLHTWRSALQFVTECRVVTINRPDTVSRDLEKADLKFPEAISEQLLADVVTAKMSEASSSVIRSRIAKHESIGYRVPLPVEKYIHEHGLYRERAGGDH